MSTRFLAVAGVISMVCGALGATEGQGWIRAGINADRPVWGLKDGIMVGIWPGAIDGKGKGGPRGLIRIGYPLGQPPMHRLVNFIAVEPDVGDGKTSASSVEPWRGLSELEPSELDRVPGKRFTAGPPEADGNQASELYPGLIDHPPDNRKAECLQIRIDVERFRNGAHPYLILSLRSDRPDEVMLQVFHHPDSAPIRMCVLTATMGNYARLRRAYLGREQIAYSKDIWPNYTGSDFAPFREVPLKRLARTGDGGVIVPMECDEADPASHWPHAPEIFWRWPYEKLTQYWRIGPGEFGDDLTFAANGRCFYWRSHLAVPGGIAFENTELRRSYRPGQAICFGMTRKSPQELLGSRYMR